MRTTYYVVTGTALAVAALVVYAQLPDLNGPRPKAPPVAETAAVEPPRLPLPAVVPPPDEPLVMPVASALPPVPATPAAPVPPPAVTPVGHTEPATPAGLPTPLPAVPPLPTVPTTDPVLPPAAVAAQPPAVPLPPLPATEVPSVPPAAPAVPAVKLPEPPALPPPAPAVPPAVPPMPGANAVVEQRPASSSSSSSPYGPQVAERPRTEGGPQPGLIPPPAPLPLPTPTPVPPPAGPGEALAGTKFVVLKDDKLVEGAVTLRGEWVLVRQGTFDRSFPKAQVQFVGDSKDEVLKFMLAKVPAADATGRLQVARWCMFNGMREQALAEARAVQTAQPTNVDAAGLVRSLEQSLQRHPPGGGPRMTPPTVPTFAADLSTRPQAPVVEPEPDVTPEAAALFPTKIQPILANQCVDCHAAPTHAGKFKLTKVAPGDVAPGATRANLRAVAAQLRKDEPQLSSLLLKTLTAHGGQKAPSAASRQAPAYLTLEAWTAVAVGAPTMPTPTPPPAVAVPPAVPAVPPVPPVAPVVSAPAVPAPPVPPVTAPALPTIPPADPLLPAVPPVAKPPVGAPPVPAVPPIPPATGGGFGAAQPPKLPPAGPTGGDEFDPAAFNRERR